MDDKENEKPRRSREVRQVLKPQRFNKDLRLELGIPGIFALLGLTVGGTLLDFPPLYNLGIIILGWIIGEGALRIVKMVFPGVPENPNPIH